MAPRPTNGLSLCAGGGGLDMGLMPMDLGTANTTNETSADAAAVGG
ncbi:hypothetical protein [Thalassobius sp. I31.1]|nr:hypothetical protein [Thalassobius sp. I31.1]